VLVKGERESYLFREEAELLLMILVSTPSPRKYSRPAESKD
jgi:hypothetical protein